MKRQITRVEIHNYRQYENITVNLDINKNIYAFEGKGGTGKSNFINALSWCLYGDEPLKSKDDGDYLLSSHLKIDPAHQNDSVSVQIDAVIGKVPVRFLRKRIEMSNLGRYDEKFATYYLKGGDWVQYENSSYFVDNFLPKSLRGFFMFDGENVKSIFNPGYEVHLKKSTEIISYIELINQTRDHLDKLLADTRKELGKEAPNLNNLVNEQNQLAEKIKNTSKYLEEDRTKLQKLNAEREKYKEKQKTIDEYKNLTQLRDNLENSQNSLKRNLEAHNINYQMKIGAVAPFVLIIDELKNFSTELARLEKNGEIPPKVKLEYIRDLLDGKVKECVCGRAIDDEARQHLNEMLESIESAQQKADLLNANTSLATVDYQLKNALNELIGLKNNIESCEKDLRQNGLQLTEISKKLSEAGGSIGSLENTIKNLDKDIDSIKERIWNEEHDLKQDQEAFDKIKREIQIQGDIENKHEILSKKINILELLIDKFKLLGDHNLQKSRVALSDTMKKFFKELYWKKDYKSILINENFEIIIQKQVDDQVVKMPISQLAGSEGATLGYALMKGLSELSGFKDTPVFIDGPISDFSEDMQKEFLNSLKSFVPQKQLFVFFKEDSHLVEPYIRGNLNDIQAFKIKRSDLAVTSSLEEWK